MCNFEDNKAIKNVGVLSLTNQKRTKIEKSTFNRNIAERKAVFQVDTRSNLTIDSSSFTNNIASKSISIGSVTDSYSIIVTGTEFSLNTA